MVYENCNYYNHTVHPYSQIIRHLAACSKVDVSHSPVAAGSFRHSLNLEQSINAQTTYLIQQFVGMAIKTVEKHSVTEVLNF